MNAASRPPRWSDYVEHIRDAAQRLEDYVAGMSKDSFLQDTRTQDAVIRNLLLIGEAASRILAEHPTSAETQPAIP